MVNHRLEVSFAFGDKLATSLYVGSDLRHDKFCINFAVPFD